MISRRGLTSRKRCRPATRYCVNCGLSVGQSRDLFIVVGVVSRPLAAGLRQFDTRRRFITSVVTAAVSDERRRSAYIFLVKIPAHHSAPSSAAGYRAVCIQTSSPRVQVSTRVRNAPAYLTDELCQVADVEARQRLLSSSSSMSSSLIVSRTRLPTVGDRAFPVAAARVWWNSLPELVTSAPSVAVFRSIAQNSPCHNAMMYTQYMRTHV